MYMVFIIQIITYIDYVNMTIAIEGNKKKINVQSIENIIKTLE